MFTEGLDENAIKWIKQGSDLDLPDPPQPPEIRSPLSERLISDHFPKSPLLSFSSNHVLPPLKFHSGLLGPHVVPVVPSCVTSDMDVDDDDEDDESVEGSGFDECSGGTFFSDEEAKGRREEWCEEDEEDKCSVKGSSRVGLNRGFMNEGLRVEVPGSCFRRFTESEVGFKQRCPPKTYTPSTANELLKRVHLRNVTNVSVRID